MADYAISAVIYPDPKTVVLITAETPPRTVTLTYTGPPQDAATLLTAGLKGVADAINGQTAALQADDARFMALDAEALAKIGVKAP